jgi:signal transduction histidine kinase
MHPLDPLTETPIGGGAAFDGWALKTLVVEQDRGRLLSLLEGQSRVLEMIAEAMPLPRTLDELMRVLEEQVDGMICSILLLSEDGKHVVHGAAPSLPDDYIRGIDGAEIGPRAGSCGTALYLRRQVIVTDIATDPLWANYKDLALVHDLRACWSTPIFSAHGEVLGSFAMYYRQPASPTRLHLSLIAVATHLARVAIERDRAQQERVHLNEQLALERQRLASIIEQLPAGVMVADASGRVILENRKLDALWRRSFVPDSLDDYRSWGVFRADGTPCELEDLPLVRSLRHGEEVSGEDFILRRPDGTQVFTSISSAPVRGGDQRITCAVVIVYDIGERKRGEQERERLIEELRCTIQARNDSLWVLSVASHELRSPLNALRLLVERELRLARTTPIPVQALEQKMASSLRQIDRLSLLVDELLDVARLTGGGLPLKRERIDLVGVVQEAAERLREACQHYATELRLNAPEPVCGSWDRMRLDLVVTNLLSNAVKYGLGKPVIVSLGGDTQRAWLEVHDSGIGIPPEQQELIFDRFGRGVSARGYEGLGLGLWISRQIVASLGGTIRVRSQPGEGSTFTVELPR